MTLAVFMHGERAGTLTERCGGVTFAYADGYASRADAVPLSVSMPLRLGSHNGAAWIEGLLPDNINTRRRWAVRRNAAGSSAYCLLASPIGLDCAGAVQFRPAQEPGGVTDRASGTHPLTEAKLAEVIEALHEDRSSWDEPGGQACFSLAGLLGLLAAVTEYLEVGEQRALMVERYDRQASSAGGTLRIHQEDMCQALGVMPERKYQSKDGPGVADIAGLITRHSADCDADVKLFRDALIFNWLIVGTDAHAKNFGMLLTAGGARMAPLYDMCSMLPYRETINADRVSAMKLAMKIGRDYTLFKSDYVKAWYRTSDALGLSRAATVQRAAYLAEALPSALEAAISELPGHLASLRAAETLHTEIERRAKHCARLPQMKRPLRQPEPLTSRSYPAMPDAPLPPQLPARPVEPPSRLTRFCGHKDCRRRVAAGNVCPVHKKPPKGKPV